MIAPTPEANLQHERRFLTWLAVLVTLLAALPALFGYLTSPNPGAYIGFQTNTDDHMVYAAWMRQAIDGHFFFDNRFTTDAQPGLTVHVYFLLLGWISKLFGLTATAILARLSFSVLFLVLSANLLKRLFADHYAQKLAQTLVVFGGGIGFLVWHTFGTIFARPAPDFLTGLMLGRLPTDVWQPEAFVFPSMLTNGLFMVSLCLILWIFQSVLDAQSNKHAVLGGATAMGLLMNIHSYDVLMVTFVLVGFLAALLARGQANSAWIGRAILIGFGAIIPALWFGYVYKNDPVFQARAATDTFSPNFRSAMFGIVPMLSLAVAGLVARALQAGERRVQQLIGVGLVVSLIGAMFVAAASHTEGYFMSFPAWGAAFGVTLVAIFLLADEEPAFNLILSWALIGLVGMYFPALFQRKLAMGMSIPWAILAAWGVALFIRNKDRSSRNLATTLVIILLAASSLRWLSRERELIQGNVSSTQRHPVFLTPDAMKIIDYLNSQPGKKVVLTIPGAGNPAVDESGQMIPDSALSPSLPDLAPIITGLTGAYSYAGHWSETPRYTERVAELYRFYLKNPARGVSRVLTPEQRAEFLKSTGANFVILPTQEAYGALPLISSEDIGAVVVSGTQFNLVKVP